jgi:alpha-beta hydrolase superfamily lysophospholipase
VSTDGSPIWFGPTERPLFGWIHQPEEASAGVVLCLPVGLESLSAHRAFRHLAETLAASGIVTLRFDYTGTGDSAGNLSDVGGIATWLQDIGAATERVRQAGVARVGMVGLRFGATLAANAAADNELEALVLWDPCESGSKFLRGQRMLAAMIGATVGDGASAAGTVEIPGVLLPKDLAESIGELGVDDRGIALARRLLLLTRPDRPASRQFLAGLSAQDAEQGAAVGQEELIDVEPGGAVLPERTIADIVTWLSLVFDETRAANIAIEAPVAWTAATVAQLLAAPGVIELPVQIGEAGIFGIVTEPEGARLIPLPTVVFLNAGVLPHSGPARLWVDMARCWAAFGIRALRVDLGGLGDSPTYPGRKPDVVYPVEAVDDILDVARSISPTDPAGVVLVGLSSGGYHGLEAALKLHSRRVWLANPGLPLVPPEVAEGGEIDARRQTIRNLNPITRRLRARDRIARLSDATVPSVMWWLFDKMHLYPSPIEAIESLAHTGADLLVICGEPEYAQYVKRARWAMRRLERAGCCRFEVIESMDHSLFNFAGRSEVMRLLSAEVLDKLAPGLKPEVPS